MLVASSRRARLAETGDPGSMMGVRMDRWLRQLPGATITKDRGWALGAPELSGLVVLEAAV